MKAKTMTDLIVEHRDLLQVLTHQIEELTIRINERDATIQRLSDELWRLVAVVSDEDAEAIERCLVAQVYVSDKAQKRRANDAVES